MNHSLTTPTEPLPLTNTLPDQPWWISTATDQGPRAGLEDRLAIHQVMNHTGEQTVTASVFDGVAGNDGGEMASTSAEATSSTHVMTGLSQLRMLAFTLSIVWPDVILGLLVSAFRKAQQRIQSIAERHPSLNGMATTAVMVIVHRDTAYFAWVGDSRAYLISDQGQRIEQVTHDHSVVQALVDQGLVDADQAANHPAAHTITRYLGLDAGLAMPSLRVCKVRPGDTIVLCTDGLTDVVDADAIRSAIQGAPDAVSFHGVARRLADQALVNGTGDNISVVVLRCPGDTAQHDDQDETFTSGHALETARILRHHQIQELRDVSN